jgi:DNA ligase (NAD+)
MNSIASLRDRILKARHAYYYSGKPIMSDAEYDALEDRLRSLEPDDPLFALVGSPVPPDSILTKARHSIPMGSQSKVNSEAAFWAWAEKSEGSAFHASLKGDGASAAAYYANGLLQRVISRGDGEVGEDITANALRFKGLPAWAGSAGLGFTGAVRLEVILTVADWAAIDPARSKNPRNAGNGIMGRKNGEQSEYLSAYAFDLDESAGGASRRFATEDEKAQRLAELGFNLMPQQLCTTVEEAVAYFEGVTAKRESLPFWIDGVVFKMNDLDLQDRLGVTSGRPKGQIAWKFDSTGAETKLVGVVISGGHTGSIVPTGQLRPVDIGGTTVSSVSLVNFDEIRRLDLAVGDSVWVIKANDIIPKITQVTARSSGRQPIQVPSLCPFCRAGVGWRINSGGEEGAVLECKNASCPKKLSGKIGRWISSLDILGIGDVVLEALIEQLRIEDAADLYKLHSRFDAMAEMLTHPERDLRLGSKRTASILAAIEAKRTLSLSQFLGSLGIEHLGKRRVELMIAAAQGELDTLGDWRSGKLRDAQIAERAGVPNMALHIQDDIDGMARVIDKMLANGVKVNNLRDAAPAKAAGAANAVGAAAGARVAGEAEAANAVGAAAGARVAGEAEAAGGARAVGEAGAAGGVGDAGARGTTVCISGKLPSGRKKAEYAAPLMAAGYTLVDEVTRDLKLLVVADPDSVSAKAEKARKLGITIIGETQLEALIAQ